MRFGAVVGGGGQGMSVDNGLLKDLGYAYGPITGIRQQAGCAEPITTDTSTDKF